MKYYIGKTNEWKDSEFRSRGGDTKGTGFGKSSQGSVQQWAFFFWFAHLLLSDML
jgi:hypothetical protein